MGHKVRCDTIIFMKEVPQAIIIDFDRTLADVDIFMNQFYLTASHFGMNVEQIKSIQAHREKEGRTFHTWKFLESHLSQSTIKEFMNHLFSLSGSSFLYADASPFLKKLQQAGIPYHVLTYSVNPQWQALKIRASGYQGDVTIMDHTNKGIKISEWKDNNRYVIPNKSSGQIVRAHSLCLIDDKAKSFASLPADCSGFLLQRSDRVLPSQQGVLMSNIQKIHSLDELILSKNYLARKANLR